MHTRSKLLPSQKMTENISLIRSFRTLISNPYLGSFLRQKVSINSDPLGIRYQIPAAHAVCGTGEIA
jgi:hypothetical protein